MLHLIKKSWYNKATSITRESKILTPESIESDDLARKIKIALYDKEQTRILNDIQDSCTQPKLRTYKTFKTTYCIEPYLTMNLPKKTYVNIARFRVSSHNLRINTGRHESPKLPINERICNKCDSNEIEDEQHCLLSCTNNAVPRIQLINEVTRFHPDFQHLNITDKFKILMSSKEEDVIKALGNFLNVVL